MSSQGTARKIMHTQDRQADGRPHRLDRQTDRTGPSDRQTRPADRRRGRTHSQEERRAQMWISVELAALCQYPGCGTRVAPPVDDNMQGTIARHTNSAGMRILCMAAK
jgi:hypothetical protein